MPRAVPKTMLTPNSSAATRTMIAPAGNRGTRALAPAPSRPLSPPSTADRMSRLRKWYVQNVDAAGGITSSAIIKISPTACRPMTVIPATNASNNTSSVSTGQPCDPANGASKHNRLNSLKSSTQMTVMPPDAAAISIASRHSMAAVLP